jgi:hypothetical protein
MHKFIQVTSLMQELHPAYVSELYCFSSFKFVHFTPRHRHRVALLTTHRSEPCEIGVIGQIARTEDVRDEDVDGQNREGVANVALERDVTKVKSVGVGGRHGASLRRLE